MLLRQHTNLQDTAPSEPYAVMVWYYGGAFQAGGSIQYPGHFLAARDVVVVVVDYRLGIFGKYIYVCQCLPARTLGTHLTIYLNVHVLA